MTSQCQNPVRGRAPTPDHVAITTSCCALWSHASGQWPPCKTGACHDSSYPSEYMRFFKDLLMVLTLSTIFYTCHFTEVCLLWNYGEGDIVLGTAFDECIPWTLTQQKLRKENLNLGICSQLWIVAWFTVLALVRDPFLEARTSSIITTSDQQENCKGATFSPSTWNTLHM